MIGSPGCGKTTLLRHIALTCSQDLLSPYRWFRQHSLVRQDYGWPDIPFPIYIPLRALRSIAASGAGDLIVGYADTLRQGRFLGTSLKVCSSDLLRQRLERGGCLLLIDGLDEVGDKSTRDRIRDQIALLPPGPPTRPNRIVVTSRKVGYEGQLQHLGFVHEQVRDLDDAQVREFVRNRFRALWLMCERIKQPCDWIYEERAERLLERLRENASLRLLTGNSLLLAIVVGLDYRTHGRPLPRERHVLYRNMMELVVHDWEQYRAEESGQTQAQQEAGQLDEQDKLRMLWELAWAMYEKTLAVEDERTYLEIRRSNAEAVLTRVLETNPSVTTAARRDRVPLASFCRQQAHAWLENLNEWSGVLKAERYEVGTGEEVLEFTHRTFQEYLASRAIDEAAPEERERRLRRLYERWNDDRWQEILLLYAAARSNASTVIAELLKYDTPAAWLMAGRVLLERPNNLDPVLHAAVQTQLQRYALEDSAVAEKTAIAAFTILVDADELPDNQTLIRVVPTIPHRTVWVRVILRLAHAESLRPASVPLEQPVRHLFADILQTERNVDLRLVIGFALARGDPRYEGDGWIPGLVEVSDGLFWMGSSDYDLHSWSGEKPQHNLQLPIYRIGKTPVTNAQWRRFMEADGYENRRYWSEAGWCWRLSGWEPEYDYPFLSELAIFVFGCLFDRMVRVLFRCRPFTTPWPHTWDNPDFNGDNQPVVGISWYEAEAYCVWLSEATGQEFCLPSEAEWEKAARGPDGLIYPWGSTWKLRRCNSYEAKIGIPTPVGSYFDGASVYGTLDMAGNVWEWCRTPYRSNYPGKKVSMEDNLINSTAHHISTRCRRGGNWYSTRIDVRGANRYHLRPRIRNVGVGLRVVSHSPRPNPDT